MKNRKWLWLTLSGLLLVIFLLASCASDGNSNKAVDKEVKNQAAGEYNQEEGSESIVTIDGEDMTRDDLAFYTLMDKIKIELNRAEDENNLSGEELADKNAYWDEQLAQYENINIGLQSMIEIKSMSLLAQEKNYFVPDEKLEAKIEDFDKQTKGNKAVTQLIQEYGEKAYYYQLREFVRESTLRDRVAKDLSEDIAEENPDASEIERPTRLPRSGNPFGVEGDNDYEVVVKTALT